MGTTAGQPSVTGSDPNRAITDPASKGQQGAGGGGSADGGTGQSGAAGVGGSEFNRDELDPALRGMTAKNINELFLGLLSQQGRNGGRSEEAARPEPKAAVEPPNYKEMLDANHDNFNPEAAFKAFVEQNYGGLLGDINKRSVQGLYSRYKSEIHDFGEFEADIEKALAGKDPTTLSDNDVLGTYLTLKGAKTLQKERQERATAAGSSTRKPSAPAGGEGPPEDDIVLSDQQKQVAHVMFGGKDDPEGEYKKWKKKSDAGPLQLNVPIDGTGKRG